MGTEVLHPQDCLIQHIRVGHAVFNHRKSYNHTRNNRKPPTNQRKKSPEKKNQNQVQKVTILKRGDPVPLSVPAPAMAPVPLSVPAPALVPVPDLSPIRLSPDMYAGSSYSLSPSPRALPLPSFFSKKQVDDSATRDLRRLLRLD